ncbi:hypothetical protein HMPREF9019_0720 [Hoylesella timonensis CRIS 5C-B1]|uniref:Uncharacterized protein n=1 Tax=Hoylesella timonensis CRIS 5C-B1 TaxID=679189 RepID=D1VW78_9BACT|nr:hypothetical protein HMPREF9019_0720 [Hoylesella timonensis CRIS 5C-B1]
MECVLITIYTFLNCPSFILDSFHQWTFILTFKHRYPYIL